MTLRTYIYKVSSDVHPIVHLTDIDKVRDLIREHCDNTHRESTTWKSFGKWRTVSCLDAEGRYEEFSLHSTKVIDHIFLVEQIEVF